MLKECWVFCWILCMLYYGYWYTYQYLLSCNIFWEQVMYFLNIFLPILMPEPCILNKNFYHLDNLCYLMHIWVLYFIFREVVFPGMISWHWVIKCIYMSGMIYRRYSTSVQVEDWCLGFLRAVGVHNEGI